MRNETIDLGLTGYDDLFRSGRMRKNQRWRKSDLRS